MPWTRREKLLLAAAVVSTSVLIGVLLYRSPGTAALDSNPATIYVSYQGAWSLDWVGYQGDTEHPTSSGHQIGYGNQSVTATVYSTSDKYGVSVCAWAGKLDGSNGTLTLSIHSFPAGLAVGGQQSTSYPFGIVRTCGRVVP